MKKSILILAAAALMLASCGNSSTETTATPDQCDSTQCCQDSVITITSTDSTKADTLK